MFLSIILVALFVLMIVYQVVIAVVALKGKLGGWKKRAFKLRDGWLFADVSGK